MLTFTCRDALINEPSEKARDPSRRSRSGGCQSDDGFSSDKSKRSCKSRGVRAGPARGRRSQRNGLTRGLKPKRTEKIGFAAGNISNPFAPELCRGLREVGEPRGYSFFISMSEQSQGRYAGFDALPDDRVDSAIVATRAAMLGNERLVSPSAFRLAWWC
jgi:hypothetical protein